MSLYDWLAGGGGILVLLMTVIQIVPIKVNPWTTLMKWIGKAMNKEVVDKLELVEKDVKELKDNHESLGKKIDKKDANSCRSRILRFADEIRRGEEHSEEFFNQILADISEYERYCSKHPDYKNSKAVNAIARIDEIYKKCMSENSFL